MPPRAEVSRPISNRSSSSRNSAKMVAIQSWISVGPPGRSVEVGAKRKARPVDDPAHDRRQAGNADQPAFAAARRIILLVEGRRHCLVVHRHEGRRVQLLPEARVSAHGRWRPVGQVQHDRFDQPPARFRHETDLAHHREELVERPIAEVDHPRDRIPGDQLIEQRHLAACVRNIDRPGQFGETPGQRRFARVEIVGDERPIGIAEELDEQAREQRLAHARARRGNDVERCLLRHPRYPRFNR